MINPVIRTFREKRTKDLRAPDVIGELFMLLMLVVIAVGAGTGSALVVALGTTAFVISAGGDVMVQAVASGGGVRRSAVGHSRVCGR